MTDQTDYRHYLESKFDALHEKLDTIVEQVKKTNGSVKELDAEDQRIEKKVDETILWAHHVVDSRATDCPLIPRISGIENKLQENTDKLCSEVDRLENDLFEWRFFKKYPKIAFVGIAIIVASIFVSVVGTIKSFSNSRQGKTILQNQQDIKDEQIRSLQRYDPFDTTEAVKADSIHSKNMDDMYDKYLKTQEK